ncbi:DUF4158 domain-containing protein [Streptomyces sp. NPDC058424]|uniref:DUF4158 domain-containing protein n=1 Tax=Streptomyces sp. NPDC058424 TaxID=3346491 RepID=UPI00364F8443
MLDDERELVAGKRSGTRLGFALQLKYYTRYGRFPRGRADFPGEVVEFVARQMKVLAADFASYPWSGSTIEYHRAQIREREGGVPRSRRPGARRLRRPHGHRRHSPSLPSPHPAPG